MAAVFCGIDGQFPGFGKYIYALYFRLALLWDWLMIVMRDLAHLR